MTESAEVILARMRQKQSERHKRWAQKQKAAGRKTITALLSIEATGRLEELRETGLSIEKVVNMAIMAFEPGGKAVKLGRKKKKS